MPSRVEQITTDTYRELARERRLLAELDDDIVRTQIEVSEIAAPTGAERRRARWVAERFAATGFDATIDGAGNVVARASDAVAAAPVVVCAHLDTVFPEGTHVSVRREGNRIVGPGICDNGRGLAVMLALAQVIRQCRAPFARAVEFVATTGEEGSGDLRGAKFRFGNGSRPFAVVALDGAGDERVVNTALGSRRFRVEYRGPGGHSWAAYGMPNPVHAAARAATSLANLRVRGMARSSLTVSRIGGGLAINAIPEVAWLEVDARSTDEAVLAWLEREVRSLASAAATEENDRRAPQAAPLTRRVERIGDRPGGHTGADTPLVVAALEATRLVGRVPELAAASTDANAAIAAGAPAIAIGGGGKGGDAHTTREWFDNGSGTAGVERALTIVATMARLAAD
ncbi:MAG TPA: M20/M25/M40 family metallo-hydrolase [Gemmatimonadaceae bacterium]|nr:M20/M25/M40 family metallo-hydrolase [Gemmatimonadaceae bacterium]